MAIDFIPYTTEEQPKKRGLDFYMPTPVIIAADEDEKEKNKIDDEGNDKTKFINTLSGIEKKFREDEAAFHAEQEKLKQDKVEFEQSKKKGRPKKVVEVSEPSESGEVSVVSEVNAE